MASDAAPAAVPPSLQAPRFPLGKIHKSKYNHRKLRNKKADAELADSVRAVGVVQPLVLRPHPTKAGEFELVCGERRYDAAAAAGLTEVPGDVRAYTDEQAREVQLVENLQRNDVHPLEEAQGYAELHDPNGPYKVPIPSIAQRVGKSREYVYARMKLTALAPKPAQAFLDGKVDHSVALLVARVPDAKLQEKAMEEITSANGGQGMTLRQAQQHMQANYMLRLAEAPFALDDAQLVPEAGACTTCPKRTGNQGVLFADVQATDTCTDPACHRRKCDAAWDVIATERVRAGQQLVPPANLKRLFPFAGTQLAADAPFVELSAPVPDDPRGRTYGQLLKGQNLPVHVARDPAHRVRELVAKPAATKALVAAGHVKAKPAKAKPAKGDRHSDKIRAEQKAEEERRQMRRHVVQKAIAAIVECAEGQAPGLGFLRVLFATLVSATNSETIKDLVARRGWAIPKGKTPLHALLQQLGATENVKVLHGLAVELLVTQGAYWPNRRTDEVPGLKAACGMYGVDLVGLEKAHRKEYQAAQKKRDREERTKDALAVKKPKPATPATPPRVRKGKGAPAKVAQVAGVPAAINAMSGTQLRALYKELSGKVVTSTNTVWLRRKCTELQAANGKG